jgi:hypothetical protein
MLKSGKKFPDSTLYCRNQESTVLKGLLFLPKNRSM